MKYGWLTGLILIIICSEKPGNNGVRDEVKRVNVSVQILSPQKFTEYGIYFGILEPLETANLVCYSGGRVEQIDVTEGQRVQNGQSLARIESAKALAVLRSAKAQKEIAKSTLEQTRRHLQNGNASQLAVDQQKLAYLNSQSAYVDALKNYRGCFAITPITGVVTKKYIDLFQELPPNSQTFMVARLDSLKIDIGITESDIYEVDVGSSALLTIPMKPDSVWHGRVKNLAKAAGEEDRVFSAELYFPNADNLLKPGISGRVQLDLVTFDSALVIPTRVIISEGIMSTVMVVDSNNVVHRRFIKTGSQSEANTLVTEGLSFGDYLITEGFQLVSEGVLVNIVKSGDTP